MPTTAYCYVDETGVCESGEVFIVGIVITGPNKEDYANLCRRIERESGKGLKKWCGATHSKKIAYMHQVVGSPLFRGRLLFATFRNTKQYDDCKLQAVAAALCKVEGAVHDSVVLIDAWPKALENLASAKLRKLGAHPKKVRGVAKDENDELIRLADALCGLVSSAYKDDSESAMLLGLGVSEGIIIELPDC